MPIILDQNLPPLNLMIYKDSIFKGHIHGSCGLGLGHLLGCHSSSHDNDLQSHIAGHLGGSAG